MKAFAVGHILVMWLVWATSAVANDEEALLEAIRRQPAEDTPRLVYADWLQEHGRPFQARFIRADIALARSPKAGGAITDEHMEAWSKGVEESLLGGEAVLLKHGIQVEWQRGFPSDILLLLEVINTEVVTALNRLPIVARLRIQGSAEVHLDAIDRLLNLTLLERIPSIWFEFHHDPNEALGRLAPRMHSLSHLTLYAPNGDPLIALGASDVAPRLKSLGLYGGQHPDYALAFHTLVESGRFSGLEALSLNFSGLSLQPFHDLSGLPALRELDLRQVSLTHGQMEHFVEAPGFRQLRILHLPERGSHSLANIADRIVEVPHHLVKITGGNTESNATLRAQVEHNRSLAQPPICALLTLKLSEVPIAH